MKNFIFKDFSSFAYLQDLETVANLSAMNTFSVQISI